MTHLPGLGLSIRSTPISHPDRVQMIGDQFLGLAGVGLLFTLSFLPAVGRIVTVILIVAVGFKLFRGVIEPAKYWSDFPAQTKRCEDGIDNHVDSFERKGNAFGMVVVGMCVGVGAIEAQGTAWSWM